MLWSVSQSHVRVNSFVRIFRRCDIDEGLLAAFSQGAVVGQKSNHSCPMTVNKNRIKLESFFWFEKRKALILAVHHPGFFCSDY